MRKINKPLKTLVLFTFLFVLFPTFSFCQRLKAIQASDCIENIDQSSLSEFTAKGNNLPLQLDSSEATIQRYLARAINMEDMARLNWNNTFLKQRDEFNCDPPYEKGSQFFCREDYCENLKMLADLNAGLIMRVAKFEDREHEIKGHFQDQYKGLYYQATAQLVEDINLIYSINNLQLPIIQAMILESITDNINREVLIPPIVINTFLEVAGKDPAFSKQITPYLKSPNPDGSDLQARDDVFFSFNNMVHDQWKDKVRGYLDLTKVEAQFWFYFQAIVYIDMGYSCIHMGQPYSWASKDKEYIITGRIIDMIKTYAAQKKQLVWLTSENPPGNYKLYRGQSSNRFLFDFDSRPMRPRELVRKRVKGDGNCRKRFKTDLFDTVLDCKAKAFLGFIDPCVIDFYGEQANGISPLGHSYYGNRYQPYSVYFDFSSKDYYPRDEASSGDNNGTWGYDDATWFAQRLGDNSEECRQAWWIKYYEWVKEIHDQQGYLQAPGMLNLDTLPAFSEPTIYGGIYMLKDDPKFVEGIRKLWEVKAETLNFSYKVTGWNFLTGKAEFELTVDQASTSSVYTWKIKNLTRNETLLVEYGSQHILMVDPKDTYEINLREDNLGFDSTELPHKFREIKQELRFPKPQRGWRRK